MGTDESSAPKPHDPSGKLAFTSALLLLVGAIFFVAGGVSLYQDRSMGAWPSVEGLVIDSEVAAETKERTSAFSGKSRTRTVYLPRVHYAYQADGRTLTSDRISNLQVGRLEESEAREIASRYPAGSTVRVYHDPEDPTRSVLQNQAGLDSFKPMAFGAALLLAAAVFRLSAARF